MELTEAANAFDFYCPHILGFPTDWAETVNYTDTVQMLSFDHSTMAFVLHGIGTMVYGERDWWPDGSHITTEWVVFAWLPIIPLYSKRISYTPGGYAQYEAKGGYYVHETKGVDRRQALFVYLWLVCVFVPFIVWNVYQEPIGKKLGNDDLGAGLFLGFAAVAFVFPYFLRRWVKRRKLREWKRQSLGLHG